MKLPAKVKYLLTKATRMYKDAPKVPSIVQLIAAFKKNKVAVTKLQAEQIVDAMKIARYEKSLKAPKAAPLAKAAPVSKAKPQEDSNLHPSQQDAPVPTPTVKHETAGQAQQAVVKTSRAYGH